MMLTFGERVGLAPVMVSEFVTTDETCALEVFPGTRWETSIASHTTGKSTARK
jgi:hypothetical protein